MLTELFAFIVIDDQGVEGVVRRYTPFGTQPMIAQSIGQLEQFRPDAVEAATKMGLPLFVARFVRDERYVAR